MSAFYTSFRRKSIWAGPVPISLKLDRFEPIIIGVW
nr:MAG TPA: hypothetical protein [Caudoviricetes sp.]